MVPVHVVSGVAMIQVCVAICCSYHWFWGEKKGSWDWKWVVNKCCAAMKSSGDCSQSYYPSTWLCVLYLQVQWTSSMMILERKPRMSSGWVLTVLHNSSLSIDAAFVSPSLKIGNKKWLHSEEPQRCLRYEGPEEAHGVKLVGEHFT